jgi:flagellar hook-associated protein 1
VEAQQGAIEATANNIANVNTPGYSRQEVVLSEGTPVQQGNLLFGSGVYLTGFQSVRDRLLDLRIQQATQQQGFADSQVSTLNQVQALFAVSAGGIDSNLSAFFNGLQQLSTNGTSSASRQSVLTAAQNLSGSFHQAITQLSNIQSNLNLQVGQYVDKVNQLMGQIASLNVQVSQLTFTGTDPGVIEDQRTELMRQLAQYIDVTDVQTSQGDTLTTANGMGLVVGAQSFDLQMQADSSGTEHVYASGQDITSRLHTGQLGSAIEARDTFIPQVISQVNTLASQLATAFNTAHRAGYDLNGNTNQNFFAVPTGAQDAANFNVLSTDPNAIAASSSQTSLAGTGNVANMLAVNDQRLPCGSTPLDYYASIVFNVGNAASQAQLNSQTAGLSVRQLQDQRNSLSGVSINEETANLIQYQRAFQASAKIVSIINDLTQAVLNIGGGA